MGVTLNLRYYPYNAETEEYEEVVLSDEELVYKTIGIDELFPDSSRRAEFFTNLDGSTTIEWYIDTDRPDATTNINLVQSNGKLEALVNCGTPAIVAVKAVLKYKPENWDEYVFQMVGV